MEDIVVPLIAFPTIFVGLPWLILHYVSQWKRAPKITEEDERMLDEMYNLARRLEDRLNTVERIVAADNPDFRPGLSTPQQTYSNELPSTNRFDRIDRTFNRSN
ncbi:envelope stress response membrane protein PspB [Sphingomonas sp. S-NIH.Pt15_0812]|uniref:envelope stress response membrane protein PspB n=1 Tax=Sphingomonas sp. S-NIH.Pt15_0812 TaxID=1920129 RepID=UPI000F7DF5E9|nr:envelope stress response membrane protein PspB [Sphingomonas sp. S-NIH.Pt15_0812]RSU54673.1 envelope stress response membrane protein PspB [Sphingomonas sp. S-NIH.Pt15_0812]